MPNRTIGMNTIRQILSLYSSGYGTKKISVILAISRNTVKKYLLKCRSEGLNLSDVLSLDESSLYRLFHEPESDKPAPSRLRELESLFPEYARRLRKKGVTRNLLYREYKSSHPEGYSLSSFNGHLSRYLQFSTPVAHLEHKAGDKMFIDYAGDKLYITDPVSGKKTAVEVFVAILPCSQLTYVEAVMSQNREDLVHACEDALLYYGGAPRVIVPDNLKAAVTCPSRYEAGLNEGFAAFASHYGCTVIPARVRKPRDKALVESAVKLIYRSIYPRLEGLCFHSLEELNSAIAKALELHNNAPMSCDRRSRRERFEELEKADLSPLNPVRFNLKHRRMATVQKNGHVRLEKHFYSVPFKYTGIRVSLLYNNDTVEVYYHYRLIASHKKSNADFGYTTDPSHLSPGQRLMSTWDPSKYIRQAASIHPQVEAYIRCVIQQKTHPEQACKSCQGILGFTDKVGRERLVNACRWASYCGLYNYRAVADILRNGMDRLPVNDAGEPAANMPGHANIRGKEYYQ